MLIGVINRFTDKGYGFIAPDDGSGDVFMHVSAIQPRGSFEPSKGMGVSFETFEGERGLKAVNVQLAQGAAAAERGE